MEIIQTIPIRFIMKDVVFLEKYFVKKLMSGKKSKKLLFHLDLISPLNLSTIPKIIISLVSTNVVDFNQNK